MILWGLRKGSKHRTEASSLANTDFTISNIIINQAAAVRVQAGDDVQRQQNAPPPAAAAPAPADAPLSQRRGFAQHSVVTPMTMVKTLVALATERMLLKTSGPTFLRGIEFMYAAGLAPDRLSVMMTSTHKYVLQFHSKCDIRPFAANYPNFGRVLRGIVHVREWRIKSIEFVNVAFYMRDVDNLERAIERLGVELVLLRNCTYPGVARGDEAVKFLSALNRKKQAVVCEYGDDRLKHRIGRRAGGMHRVRRPSRNGQEVLAPVEAPGAQVIPPAAIPENPPPGAVEQRPLEAHIEIRDVARPAPVNNNGGLARRIIQQQMMNANVERFLQHPEEPAIAPNPIRAAAVGNIIPGNAIAALRARYAERQAAAQQDAAVPAVGEPRVQQLPDQVLHDVNRVVVGAHIYEFRALHQPNANAEQQLHNVEHLVNVLQNNSTNDVRVIVLPSRQDDPDGPINFNNNEAFNLRQIYDPIAARPLLPGEPLHYIAPVRANGQPALAPARAPIVLAPPNPLQEARIHYELPAQLLGAGVVQPERERPPVYHRYVANPRLAAPPPGPPVPMFGDAVNEPQVQRNGDDSNDSTDREELAEDVEQRRNDALNDLVADPTAQPNFAPVEAEAVDLDMLEEEPEGEDDETMPVDGEFAVNDQAVIQ